MYFKYLKLLYIISLISLIFSGCYKDEYKIISQENVNIEINKWIYNIMCYYYYWEKDLPRDNNINYQTTPSDFFNSLLTKNDKFSVILNKETDIFNSDSKNFGFECVFGYLNEDKTLIGGQVILVYPNSIAEKQEIKRGDIFTAINDISLTIDNYEKLFSQEAGMYLFLRYEGGEYVTFNKNLKKDDLEINPIYKTEILEIETAKIGYICYNQFVADNGDGTSRYINELLECFKSFKNEGINNLVVDFRYNSGGLINISSLLTSLIVPAIDTTKIALKFEYNEKLMEQLQNIESSEINLKFSYYPESYIGDQLQSLYFIVSGVTASASEAVINALSPYVNFVLVGEKTYGKNYASILFTKEDKLENNYFLMPIVMKVLNAKNESDYENGFIPDYIINEFMYPLFELGDSNEIILNYIISEIVQDCLPITFKERRFYSPYFFDPIKYTVNLPDYEFMENTNK